MCRTLNCLKETKPESSDKGKWFYSKGLEKVAVKETSISKVNGEKGKLIYRGIDITELVEKSCFEEVAFLIYNGHLPTREEYREFCKQLKNFGFINEKLIDFIRTIKDIEDYMDILKIVVSYIGSFDKSDGKLLNKALKLVAMMPVILSFAYRIKNALELIFPDESLSHAGNLYYMFTGEKPDEVVERILDAALILHAEQGMNASTFSALVISSTMTDIYSAISGALGCLKGPLHGGANREVLDMFDKIGSPKNVKKYVEDAIAKKKKIMGFGHRVYKTFDPRALILKKFAMELQGKYNSPYLEIALEMEKEVLDKLGKKSIYPNVDFYSGIVYDMIGFPREVFTSLFAVSRVVGWTAHIIEYRCENRIFRPTSIYTGPTELKYIPFEER
ncbi:MAG: citrate synthase [Candidatus Neomarinimicrobiota bacterium]|mgnify:CR=1 FL=1|nr:citrate/2-methylcitrate synthase [Candidatus Neomarinimicrobiota bacterium]RKY47744.1 MAG: citrate synthase [Candidatus Neomarinimicrobiota bacterium]RKY54740.1 MAG: citrate synthase [Candidatus Neomarinimicrobiota bacterium]